VRDQERQDLLFFRLYLDATERFNVLDELEFVLGQIEAASFDSFISTGSAGGIG